MRCKIFHESHNIYIVRNRDYEQEFAVIRPDFPDVLKQYNQPIKLEVGIEDWLHLVFDVNS